MADTRGGTLHATAFLLGETGLLITGPSGAGKSMLVAGLAALWRNGPVRLVADDRVRISIRGGRAIARPVAGFLGKLELRGLGIADQAAMPSVVLRAVLVLEPIPPPRMPDHDIEITDIFGVSLPRLRLLAGAGATQELVAKWPHFTQRVKTRS